MVEANTCRSLAKSPNLLESVSSSMKPLKHFCFKNSTTSWILVTFIPWSIYLFGKGVAINIFYLFIPLTNNQQSFWLKLNSFTCSSSIAWSLFSGPSLVIDHHWSITFTGDLSPVTYHQWRHLMTLDPLPNTYALSQTDHHHPPPSQLCAIWSSPINPSLSHG